MTDSTELPDAVMAADCVALPTELPDAVIAADCVALPTELPDAVIAADCVALPTELPEAVIAADSTADSEATILGVAVPAADTVELSAAVVLPTGLLDTLVKPLTDAEPLALSAAVGLCAALADPVTLPTADSEGERVCRPLLEPDPETDAVRDTVFELLTELETVAPTVLVTEPDEDRVSLTVAEGERVPETLAVELLLPHAVADPDLETNADREAVAAAVPLPDIEGVIVGATVTVIESIGD